MFFRALLTKSKMKCGGHYGLASLAHLKKNETRIFLQLKDESAQSHPKVCLPVPPVQI